MPPPDSDEGEAVAAPQTEHHGERLAAALRKMEEQFLVNEKLAKPFSDQPNRSASDR